MFCKPCNSQYALSAGEGWVGVGGDFLPLYLLMMCSLEIHNLLHLHHHHHHHPQKKSFENILWRDEQQSMTVSPKKLVSVPPRGDNFVKGNNLYESWLGRISRARLCLDLVQ